jgi:hypothetical protein
MTGRPVSFWSIATGAVDDRVVAVAGLRIVEGNDEAGAGVHGDLGVGAVAVVLARGG